MLAVLLCGANVLATRAYVPGPCGALGAGNMEPQLLLSDCAGGGGGAHDVRAQHPERPVPRGQKRAAGTNFRLALAGGKLPKLPLTMPDGKSCDILSWWKQRDHSKPYDQQSGRPEGLPRLARMARQYHNEPASSSGAERLFSAAGRAHHDLKGAMADLSLEHELLALANTD